MRNNCVAVAAFAAVVVSSSQAFAVQNPFTEDFDANASGWTDVVSQPASWFSIGGPDGGAFSSVVFNFVGSALDEDKLFARGHDSLDASGDAFVGDWLGAGVSMFSFSIRHDAGVPLTFFTRIATSANFPGANAITESTIPSGQWTTVMFPIDLATWAPEGPPSVFGDVFGAVGNIQLGARTPSALAGVDQVIRFDFDKITIVPTPGVGALLLFAGVAGLRRRRG